MKFKFPEIKIPTFNQLAGFILVLVMFRILSGNTTLTADVKQAFLTGLTLILGYLFGSSVGSQAKDTKTPDKPDSVTTNATISTTEVTKNN